MSAVRSRVLVELVDTAMGEETKKLRGGENRTMNVHDLTIDLTCSELRVKGNPVSLGRTEFRILHFLACHPGCAFTRDQIIIGVRGEDYPVTARAIDVQIVGLRKKLGSARKHIETVRGVGYRFRE